MKFLNKKLRQQFREESLEEVRHSFPDVKLPGTFEEAMNDLESGKLKEVEAFLFYYHIYSEKCEEAATEASYDETSSKNDSLLDTKDFLKKMLKEITKEK